jgi:hypothetical protein
MHAIRLTYRTSDGNDGASVEQQPYYFFESLISSKAQRCHTGLMEDAANIANYCADENI